jgi:uncharacterized protein (DUF58 family)
VRSIDWKVTARLQKPHVRVFNEERDRPGFVVVDQRLSMFFGTRVAMKSVTAAETAAIAAWRILAAGDRVGAVVFNDSDIVDMRPQRSRRTVLEVLSTVVEQNQALGIGRGIVRAPAMLNRALERVHRVTPHDATIVVISDFDGADASTRDMVGGLARHNDVIAALVHDPTQSELPAAGRMIVSEGELQVTVDIGRESVRRSILEMSETRLRDVLSWTPDLRVPVLPLSTAEETAPQIVHLLGRLTARRGRGAGAKHG